MNIKRQLAAAAGVLVLARRHARRPEDPDQRCGGHVPQSDLLEVVQRVQQAEAAGRDQLPVDWLGRRHPPDPAAHGVLRRDRRPDDGGADAGRARQDPSPPDGPRRGRAGLQHPGRQAGAEVHGPAARRHHARQDHQMERPGDCQVECRRHTARHRHRRRSPVRRLRHDVYLGRLPFQGIARVPQDGGRRDLRQMARRRRRQGQRGCCRARQPDARAHSATSS